MTGKDFFKRVFTPGTIECAVACAIAGLLVAFLLLWLGVWKTLLIVGLAAIGGFLGGVKDKKGAINRFLNLFRKQQ